VIHQRSFTIPTRGRGTIEITAEIERAVAESGVRTGLCNVFIRHTSASLIVCENADPSVRQDLERFAARLAPDGDPIFRHTLEGPDDMPAHLRAMLLPVSLSVPVAGGRLRLGTWQGLYLFEHRDRPQRREIAAHFA
jgi:secondary thiamine-phosphate synthase enzyme